MIKKELEQENKKLKETTIRVLELLIEEKRKRLKLEEKADNGNGNLQGS